MTTAQLELPFMAQDPQMRLIQYMEGLEERFNRNRKSLHAKASSTAKEVDELKHKLAVLEAVICKGQLEFIFESKGT